MFVTVPARDTILTCVPAGTAIATPVSSLFAAWDGDENEEGTRLAPRVRACAARNCGAQALRAAGKMVHLSPLVPRRACAATAAARECAESLSLRSSKSSCSTTRSSLCLSVRAHSSATRAWKCGGSSGCRCAHDDIHARMRGPCDVCISECGGRAAPAGAVGEIDCVACTATHVCLVSAVRRRLLHLLLRHAWAQSSAA